MDADVGDNDAVNFAKRELMAGRWTTISQMKIASVWLLGSTVAA
jgi:hypothetical protein